MNYSERKRENGVCVENRKTHKCERKHLLSYKHWTQYTSQKSSMKQLLRRNSDSINMTLQFQRSGVKNCLPFLFTFELAPSPEFFGDVANRWSYFFLSLKKGHKQLSTDYSLTHDFRSWENSVNAGKLQELMKRFHNCAGQN